VAERSLNRHDVAAGGDETGRVEVAQVVQPDSGQTGVYANVRFKA